MRVEKKTSVDTPKHAASPLMSDFTLCGVAFDVDAVDSAVEAPVFADAGAVVTCARCRVVITACHMFGSQFRVPR